MVNCFGHRSFSAQDLILNMALPQSHSLYINRPSVKKFLNEIVFDNCDDPYQYFFRRVHDIACLLDECMNCFLKARICQITPKDLSSKDDLSFYIVGSRCSSKVMISKFWNDNGEIFGISLTQSICTIYFSSLSDRPDVFSGSGT